MSSHPKDEVLVDLAEGRGTPEERAHAAGCGECARRVEEASAAWDAALLAKVPEPPGLYWETLRRNVRRRIEEEPRERSPWWWLAPVAATAGLLALAFSLGGLPPWPGEDVDSLPAWSALPPVEEDEDLAVVTGFAQEDDTLVSWDEGRDLGALLAILSDEETEALVEGLGAGGGKEDL